MAFAAPIALQSAAVAAKEDNVNGALLSRQEASKVARLDVEFKTGKAFLRCKLLRVIADPANNTPRTLRIQDGESGKTIA